MEMPFVSGEILIPKTDLKRWSVVACDQFTSQPSYWEETAHIAGDSPSALNVIFPEAFLGKVDFESKISEINTAMERYLAEDIFNSCNGMVYCRRTLSSGAVRQGVVGLLDLSCYNFEAGSKPAVRATEGTVLDRIPPRVRIRENAPLELPHVMVLADDPTRSVVEPMAQETEEMEKLYDFPLMQGGGSIAGWLMSKRQIQRLTDALAALPNPADTNPLMLAVGDGNHSLATARTCYLQKPTALNRYALVELCNLHDDSLVFAPIHRAVFGVDPHKLFGELTAYCKGLKGGSAPQSFTVVSSHGDYKIAIEAPECNLAVGSVQQFLDSYIARNGGQVDYIHGEREARSLVANDCVAILLPAMDKTELFPTVIKDGVLPRKTFSMGEACEKRYYLESRRIR